jgi:hypothetical protein
MQLLACGRSIITSKEARKLVSALAEVDWTEHDQWDQDKLPGGRVENSLAIEHKEKLDKKDVEVLDEVVPGMAALTLQVQEELMQALPGRLFKFVRAGFVSASSGKAMQVHTDLKGPLPTSTTFTVLVPLQIPAGAGGTKVFLRSQNLPLPRGENFPKQYSLSTGPVVETVDQEGCCYLLDGLVHHRGEANTSTENKVLFFVTGACPMALDASGETILNSVRDEDRAGFPETSKFLEV